MGVNEIMKLKEFKRLMKDDKIVDTVIANINEIYTASINCCSKEVKCMVIMEELAELQQVVSKFARGELKDMDMLLEEMADVMISIDMLERMNRIDDNTLLHALAVKLYREGVRRGVIEGEKSDD